ncbi:MAG TPA: hypothetical protein EYP23_02700 [Thermoplasmata archaeon]|nr:hypothetical protein [Thermoplasmata archaeon]
MIKKKTITLCFVAVLILIPQGAAEYSVNPRYTSGNPTILICMGRITNIDVDGNHWEFTTVSLWYIYIESTGDGIHLQIGRSANDYYNLYGYVFKGITIQGLHGNTFLFGSFIQI